MRELNVLVHVGVVRTLLVAQVADVAVLQLDLVDVDEVEDLLAALLEGGRHPTTAAQQQGVVSTTAATTAAAPTTTTTTADVVAQGKLAAQRSVNVKTWRERRSVTAFGLWDHSSTWITQRRRKTVSVILF